MRERARNFTCERDLQATIEFQIWLQILAVQGLRNERLASLQALGHTLLQGGLLTLLADSPLWGRIVVKKETHFCVII